jgi:hypothetical protein
MHDPYRQKKLGFCDIEKLFDFAFGKTISHFRWPVRPALNLDD